MRKSCKTQLLVVLMSLVLSACSGISAPATAQVSPHKLAPGGGKAVQTGVASWYGVPHHGRKTASGERFDMNALTAAHPTLPLGSAALVTNAANGRSVVVTVNDRGPYAPGRVIDLSAKAAEKLGMKRQGTAKVSIKPLAGGQEAAEASEAEKGRSKSAGRPYLGR